MKTNKTPNWIKRRIVILVVALLAVAGFFAFLIYRAEQVVAPVDSNTGEQADNSISQEQPEERQPESLPNLQATVDEWLKTASGEYSIVIHDLATGEELASHRPDVPYFTASIYKLYVAYLGYMDIQAGDYKADELFLGEWTRAKCLDEMIRTSHSPCAEKLWVEQGKEAATARLHDFGLEDTSLVGLNTTAADSNKLLVRLHAGKDLSKTQSELLLKSMEEQVYRDALSAGADDLVVANKVGFRELVEYHDVGIITLKSGRQIAISVYSLNAGPRRIAELTRTLITALDTAKTTD